MFGWFAYLWLKPEPAPYRYQLVEEGEVGKFANLGLEAWPGLRIGKYEVRVESVDRPIAVVYRASTSKADSQPIMLSWESRVTEPIGSIGGNLSELTTVATAIAQYVPKNAVVLAWWDISRQVRLLADRDTLFTSHHGQPVIAPSYWRGRVEAIERYEREFWGAPAQAEESRQFQRFADALKSDADEGVAMLRELAGSRDAYVVVHVADLYKLGLMRPDRLDMAFKDFPLTGNVHGLVGQVKAWMKDNGYETYTLQGLSDKMVRAYFLQEGKNGKTLLAQMLPFMDRTPRELQAVQLVHNHGGYWVYKIPPMQPSGR